MSLRGGSGEGHQSLRYLSRLRGDPHDGRLFLSGCGKDDTARGRSPDGVGCLEAFRKILPHPNHRPAPVLPRPDALLAHHFLKTKKTAEIIRAKPREAPA